MVTLSQLEELQGASNCLENSKAENVSGSQIKNSISVVFCLFFIVVELSSSDGGSGVCTRAPVCVCVCVCLGVAFGGALSVDDLGFIHQRLQSMAFI